ncbi:protoporphyrinogen oxidase-like protein [Candidatus Saccharibacteria bacterium]|nr:MAG: protoporphyrinogen oxidase-like protein [Candidatus Saccharibacteria bacterium]
MSTIILGSGFTGLAAGIKTGFPIYEASNHAGGICTTYAKDGFQFSNGGPHFLFGKGVGLDYIKSLVPVNEYERKAGVYYNHIFPYPLQTTAQKVNAVNKGSLKEWLGNTFSQAECNLFFNPFNEKYTAGLYDQVVQVEEFKSPPAGGVGFVSTFCDPVNGLTDLVSKMAEKCTINYNHEAIGIDTKEKIVFFKNKHVKYEKLISTIPLGRLLRLCGREGDFKLPCTSVLVINIGADKAVNTPDEHWLYVPFCKSGFHRLCFYSNVDKSKAPEGKVGMAVEIAYYGDQPDIERVSFEVIKELQDWGMIGKVITIDPTIVKVAYTWEYNKGDAKKEIDWLRERDIISTGRYGKHKFQGMVDSIKDGFEVEL